MNDKKIFGWSVTVGLAGFLFGFDTAVISGADKPIQTLWHLSDLFHGTFIMSMALWGTVIGALFGGIPCDRFGRKKTLIGIGVLYLISAIGSGLAPDPFSFSLFRLIGGIGVGASSVAAPTYISEIAPSERRGRLVALYQVNIVFGILVAFLSNFLLSGIGETAWRWMLGIEALPAAAYLLMVTRVPNSPRWLLLHKKDEVEAQRVLQMIQPQQGVGSAISEIKASANQGKRRQSVFSKKYSLPLTLAFLLAFFNQFSGINAVIYYAPRIFETTSFGAESSYLSTVGIGIINLIFTLCGMYLIDRSGRKRLMLIGSIGYIVTLTLVARAYFTGTAEGTSVAVLLFGFIAAHAIGQGAVIWVFISEIFPNKVRAAGQSFGSSTHWVFAAIITLVGPSVLKVEYAGWTFALFAGMMVLQLLFVLFMMPETKGIPLEELQRTLTKGKATESESQAAPAIAEELTAQ